MGEILKELKNNCKKISQLIAEQKFTVGDAQKFLERWQNIYRSMEDLEKSRDSWKRKNKGGRMKTEKEFINELLEGYPEGTSLKQVWDDYEKKSVRIEEEFITA